MEIGAVNEIAPLEHILLPHPGSWWINESKLIKFEEGKERVEVISRKKFSFNWLNKLLSKLKDVLENEGISTTYLYFAPELEKQENGKIIYLRCNPSYLSCFLRDIGIFTKNFFLAAEQSEDRKLKYGNIARKFAEKVQTFGIDVKYSEFEGGSFISNGNVSFATMKNSLKTPNFMEECGKFYEFPTLNLHVDNFINFLSEKLFTINYSCLESCANEIEYINSDLSCIDKIVTILKKKGYKPVEIHGYGDGSEYIVNNFLTLGNNKIVMIDPLGFASKKIEKEGIDVINLYEEESFYHLKSLRGGLRCLTLPIKRRY